MRKAMFCLVLLSVPVLMLGCSSGGIEEGIPKDVSKVPDPMAGVKVLSNPSPKAAFNDPMKTHRPAARTNRGTKN